MGGIMPEALYHLIFHRVKKILNPKLHNLLTKRSVSDIKKELAEDPLLQQFVGLHFDILQNKTDPMALKLVEARQSYKYSNDWKIL